MTPLGHQPRVTAASTSARARARCVALLAITQIGLAALAMASSAIGIFALFRYLVATKSEPVDLPSAARDRTVTDYPPNRLELPSPAQVVSEVLSWQPPVLAGSPSPLDHNAALEVATGDHVLGSGHAPITLMLFGDLMCPYTADALRNLAELVQAQPKDYRLVWRERPLDVHPQAFELALAAERMALQYGEVSFWRFILALARLNGAASRLQAAAVVEALETGTPKLDATQANGRARERIERDRIIALTYSIHATPTLFVNGLRFEGDVDSADLDEVLDDEQQEVQALQDDGVPQAQIYSLRVDANLLDIDGE